MFDDVLSQPVASLDWVAVDTETTGLRVTDRPVEVGAVRLSGGRLTETFSSLVDPEGPVPAEASAIHGLTTADLAEAPPAAEVLAALTDFGRGAVWLAHNAGYDAGILGMAYLRAGLDAPTEPVLDTCRLARHCLPGADSYRLESLGRSLGLAEEGYHRALADAHVAAGLFLRCLERLGGHERRPLQDLARRAGGWLTMAGVAAAARHVPAGFEGLMGAIDGQRQVVLSYDGGGRGRVRSRRVAPKVLYRSGRRTYLEAFCYEGRFVKSYRLDRIRGYEVLERSTRRSAKKTP